MPDTNGQSTTVTPLPRTEFGSSTAPMQPPTSVIPVLTAPIQGSVLDDADLVTLRRALQMMKSARTDLTSKDPRVVAAARRRLLLVVSYVHGFLESKGLIRSQKDQLGFEVIIGLGVKPSFEATLDELVQALDTLVSTPPTRLTPAGAFFGTLCVMLGEYLLAE